MTSFALLAVLMVAAATAWMTHPIWRPALAANTLAMHVPPRGPLLATAALAGFVLFVVGAGYAWLGASHYVEVGPASAEAAPAAPDAPDAKAAAAIRDASASDALSQAEARISGMVDRLAERLKTRPDDADGWQMLGRSYAALGKHGQAVGAFETALRLKPDDATLLAELAFSAAITNRSVGGADSTQLLQRALKLDPANPKALALAGTLSLDRKDYQGAVQYWEQLARIEPPESVFGKQVRQSIAQARDLAGAQGVLLPVSDAAAPGATPAAPAGATIGGTVTLAPALRRRVSPDDTVFVFARAANGPRMPLAVLRKQVKDLPLRFTLDDSLAMSPSAKLSSASTVLVGARISKSGSAIAQNGDLQVQLAGVALGSSALKLEINEVVKAAR